MTLVEIYRVARENPAHAGRQRQIFCFTKQMKMIRHQNPGIYLHGDSLCQSGQAIDEIITICIAQKYFFAFNVPAPHMVKHAWRI